MGELRIDGRRVSNIALASKFVEAGVEVIHLVLKGGDVIAHLIELATQSSVTGRLFRDGDDIRRVLERVGAAVGCIHALEVQIAASLAWCTSVAFYLTPIPAQHQP